MKIEHFQPEPIQRIITSIGGGITSPNADPPHEPVFVIDANSPWGAGHRITLTEAEVERLYPQMGQWLKDLERQRKVTA